MNLLKKSTYSLSHDIDANPTKQLEKSTEAYVHASFLLWEYKQNFNKKEYRELLQEFGWDKGATEQRRALKLAEYYQGFVHRPHTLFQIPVTTLLKLCSDKYKLIIQELEATEQEITFDYVDQLIKERQAHLNKEKESKLPKKPSIWKRNCRGERYPYFPPVYEKDEQTGILTQKLMDEYGLTPQYILRIAIFDFYNKYTLEPVEESVVHNVNDVAKDQSESNDYDNNEPDIKSNQIQTVEEKWSQLNQQLKTDIENIGEVSLNTGQLIFESCQQWEAAVPTFKRWSAISEAKRQRRNANICEYSEKLLKYLSNYAYGNHTEWRHSWGAMLASFDNFEQELEWVPSIIRIDALIAMGYKIPATVEVKLGEHKGEQGRIVELHGDTTAPILVEFDNFQEYFHWNELDIIAEAETFARYITVEELQQSEYLEEPSEFDIEIEQVPLKKAVDTLINGNWEDIRNIFNEYPQVKEQAWKALNAIQRQRVVDITPEIVKVLNIARKDGVISEYKEIAVGVYQVKLPSKILWEQRVYHEIEIRHYLKGWREKMSCKN